MFRDGFLRSGLAFVMGVAILQQLPELPNQYWLLALPVILLLGLWQPRIVLLSAFTAGFLWAALLAHQRLARELPQNLIGKDILVTGFVHSIPERDDRRTRLIFKIVEQISTSDVELATAKGNRKPSQNQVKLPLPFHIRLSWYATESSSPPDLVVGQRWQLRIRLKPPIGFMNPGGFDYEGWLFRQNIRASGYVREDRANNLTQETSTRYLVSRFRSNLFNRLRNLSQELQHRGILLALALGYRKDIDAQDWDLLLRTGTNHLMAISGLHIGLVAGLVYGLFFAVVNFLCVREWVPLKIWPAQRIAAMGAWGGSFIYTLLSGFALPAQRALIMLSVGLCAVMAYRQLRPAQALIIALVVVLIFDPFAVNSAGFWLSFFAVAVLVYSYAGRGKKERPRMIAAVMHWGRVQGLLLIGLMPLTIFWFGSAAVSASAANLIAIPLVGLFVVPITLLASLFSLVYQPIAGLLLQIADQCLQMLWPILQLMQELPVSRWQQPQPPLWATILALLGSLFLLAPRGLPGRWVGAFWMLPLLFYAPSDPEKGEFFLSVLDVGQGTAVVIQTAQHSLIYDTGPKLNERFDAGKLVILPYLKTAGISKVDVLLVSHGDNDHIGGSAAIIDHFDVQRVISSVPKKIKHAQPETCSDNQRWEWDGVRFHVLHPDKKAKWQGNNSSCVLLVETKSARVLLTGDIEKRAEQHILREHQLQTATLLLVPHHGSRTSSTRPFIHALRPQHAVFNAGLFNRFGFPKNDVVDRYRELGSAIWITGEQGALEFQISASRAELRRAYRLSERRYWHYLPSEIE